MDLSLFLHKTDIQLYKSILNKINKDFDSIEPSVLGDLLDKLKDIHSSLENVVRQKSIQQMYDTPKNKRMNLIRLKMDKEELEKIRKRKEFVGSKKEIELKKFHLRDLCSYSKVSLYRSYRCPPDNH